MRNAMCWLLATGIVVLSGVASPRVGLAQGAQPGQQDENTSEPTTELELEGELLAVDLDKRLFLIGGEKGELLFFYDDQTEVRGQTEGATGLTGQTGTWLRIQYRAEGTRAIAETIELGESGRERGRTPADRESDR